MEPEISWRNSWHPSLVHTLCQINQSLHSNRISWGSLIILSIHRHSKKHISRTSHTVFSSSYFVLRTTPISTVVCTFTSYIYLYLYILLYINELTVSKIITFSQFMKFEVPLHFRKPCHWTLIKGTWIQPIATRLIVSVSILLFSNISFRHMAFSFIIMLLVDMLGHLKYTRHWM
jgi:hypothetical protein